MLYEAAVLAIRPISALRFAENAPGPATRLNVNGEIARDFA